MAKQGRQRGQQGQPGQQGQRSQRGAAGQGGAGQGRQTRQELRRVAAERAAQRKAAEQAAQRRRLFAIGGAIAVAVVIAAVLIIVNLPDDDSSDDLPAIVANATPYAGIPFDGRFLGSPDAPVTLVEYGDYQCPFCGAFARDISPQFVADYVATGRVRFEFKDFIVIDAHVPDGHESHDAAEAAACAMDQGRFWEYHDALYNNQHGENQGDFAPDRLEEIARQLGLNMDQFNECVAGNSHDQEIADAQAEGQSLGVSSTPSFAINGQVFQIGNYDDLKAKLDEALAAAPAA